LEKVLLEKSVNKEKDLQEALHCLNEGMDQKCGDKHIEFNLLMGRAKLNLFRHNFGHCKDDCLNALKLKQDEQIWYILIRTRYFVKKFEECQKYATEGLTHFPKSEKIKDFSIKAGLELKLEKAQL